MYRLIIPITVLLCALSIATSSPLMAKHHKSKGGGGKSHHHHHKHKSHDHHHHKHKHHHHHHYHGSRGNWYYGPGYYNPYYYGNYGPYCPYYDDPYWDAWYYGPSYYRSSPPCGGSINLFIGL